MSKPKIKITILLCFVSLGHAILDIDKTLNGPRFQTLLGGIRGFYDYSPSGRKYMAFEGVPYAEPPIRDLRFRAPQKVKSWVGDIVAIKTGSPCLQYIHAPDNGTERIIGSEDCLYLNIYKPITKTTRKLPVIVWIHGGAFQWHMEANDGQFTRPDYLMDQDVMFVSFSYRVGPLGFLSTEDDHISGNMGLKDQTMAIRWVKENIEAFGGDPENISIFGLSAGGVSVHYQYLSPLSKGLFKRGISFSGTALNCWGLTEGSAEKAKKVASIVSCPDSSTEKMVKCLRSRPARQIARSVMHFMPWLYNPMTPFGPVIERSTAESPFITKSPVEIITSGEAYDAPWITGIVPEEGIYPGGEFCANKELLRELDAKWDTYAPFVLDYNYTIPHSKHIEVGRKIRHHYIGNKSIDRTTALSIIHMIGDRLYTADGVKAAKMMAQVNTSPVFYYYFTYKGAESVSHFMTKTYEDWGVAHGDDLYYMIKSPSKNPTTTSNDRMMQRDLINFWTSFATNGIADVGIKWTPVNGNMNQFNYLHIYGPGIRAMNADNNLGQTNLWSSINFNENKIYKV